MTDLIFHNANIITMDPDVPSGELVAIKDGRISAVTSNDALNTLKQNHTDIIDCGGKTILPGFIDPHCHLHAFAENIVALDLSPKNTIQSIADICAAIHAQTQKVPDGTWIRGKGYNEFYLDEKQHPLAHDLDTVSPHHPVILWHRSGHAHVLNSLAMKHAGITISTPEPDGSRIERDAHTGEPNGLLYEMGDFLSKKIPPMGRIEREQGIKLANTRLLSKGITTVNDVSARNNGARRQLFKRWKENGLITPKVNLMIGYEALKNYTPEKDNGHQISITGCKIMLEDITGRLYPSQGTLNDMVLDIHNKGLQAAIHAIEQPAVESACAAIEAALKKNPRQDHRHRIEHCSICQPDLAKRIAKNNIVVVTQPAFIYYSGERYLDTVPGDQFSHLYPFRRLINSGIFVAGSSDVPIVPPDPIKGIYGAVTRKADTGEPVLETEAVSPFEALRLFTINAAFSMRKEHIKGSLSKGKAADMVVLSQNPLTVHPEDIKDIEIEMTIINGSIAYKK